MKDRKYTVVDDFGGYSVSNVKDPMRHGKTYGECDVAEGCSYKEEMTPDSFWGPSPNNWSAKR